MAEEENKKKKEDNKNDENKMQDPSKLKTNYDWECYKDTGNC